MKDYAWKFAERYPNHEKHMSLRDGVEMEVEGHGDKWTWNVRTVTGTYIAKDGKAESRKDAKRKAEGAADGVRALAKNSGRTYEHLRPPFRGSTDAMRTSPRHRGR